MQPWPLWVIPSLLHAMKYLPLLGLIAAPAFAQGPLTPLGPPGPTQKSLQEIWDRMGTLESIVVSQQQQIALLQQQNSILLSASNIALPWSYETVYIDLPLGDMSLAFAPSGQPAIAYCDEDTGFIKYALRSTTGWTVTTVGIQGGPDADPSLAFSSAGLPMIAYHRGTEGPGLYAASFDGSSWSTIVVDAGDTGYHPVLAFSPTGIPTIAYEDTEDNGIGLADTAGGGAWGSFEIIAAGAERPSLAFDPDGEPAVAYQIGVTALRLSRMINGAWVTSTIDELDPESEETKELTDLSLAFSPSGQPAVSYDFYDGDGDLMYAIMDGDDNWQKTSVTSGSDWGFHSTLRFSPAGQATISHTLNADLDSYDSNIGIATLKSGVWQKEYLGVTNPDKFDSGQLKLAFTRGGQPAVIFAHHSALRYAVKGPFH
jgi:hypothetical protein